MAGRDEAWGDHIEAAREAAAEIANTIAQFEPVSMVVKPKNVAEVSLLTKQGVNQVSVQHDDCWIRDMGPVFVASADNQVAGIDWNFNGWGHRYPEYDRDNARRRTNSRQLEDARATTAISCWRAARCMSMARALCW